MGAFNNDERFEELKEKNVSSLFPQRLKQLKEGPAFGGTSLTVRQQMLAYWESNDE